MASLLILAFALAMDAFAVAVAQGVTARVRVAQALWIALAFGVAQGAMPLVGWELSNASARWIAAVDHWIAFVLLGAIGVKMIHESRREQGRGSQRLSGLGLLAAAVATSIDAAVAGITLPLLGLPITVSCVTIGAVTAALCFVGALAGGKLGARAGPRAELIGGIVLIGLGTRILIEHLSA
ncbi:MAG: manganese efflux pump [Sphingomonadaceae bacterium]|nr:manganese efflux pump [Sphingomonadaceae bacterium]